MPHTHQASNFHYCPHGQRGAALMIMLVIMVMGAATVLVSSLNSSGLRIERDKITAGALAQAKDALIGYAATYRDTHPSQVHGYLPCPDTDGSNGLQPEGSAESGSGSPCANVSTNQNVSVMGRLPWKTLDLLPLRDGNGECLWYAVSGTYKSLPKTDMMNWDINGLFEIMASDGVGYLAGSAADNRAVAVIFSPGAVSGNQDRAAGGSAPTCGGNYTASNYLDNDTVHSTNNSAISATANAASRFVVGLVKDASDNVIVNDRVIFITKDDIFKAIKKRNDFGAFVSSLLTPTTCLSALPAPVTMTFNNPTSPFTTETSGGTTVGSLETGRVPKACLTSPLDNWQDNLLYARCTSGTVCLTVNSPIPNCKGIVIFAGERNASQPRITNTQKNTWSNYLEGTAPTDPLTAFTTGATTITGASLPYSPASPSADILVCIP